MLVLTLTMCELCHWPSIVVMRRMGAFDCLHDFTQERRLAKF